LHGRLSETASACCDELELIFVDDGSTDGTLAALRRLGAADPRVRYLSLSRNFGHEVAVAAGLDRADGDTVVLIDADLQDPPELIGKMVERWRAGAMVVYAQRTRRRGDRLAKRTAIYFFYRLLGRISEVPIPLDTGNFRLMDRRVVEVVKACRENPRFVRGLVPWAGFRQEALPYDRDPRHAGETGYGLVKLVRLAFDGICSFSMVPLRLSTWLGAAVILLSVLLTTYVVVERLVLTPPTAPGAPATSLGVPRGFAFLACVMLFLGGVQLFMLGMLATYVGYIFKNVQGRPMYVVAEESVSWQLSAAKLSSIVIRESASNDPSLHTERRPK
jgi:dolichol-phosphate mannosyltransferase